MEKPCVSQLFYTLIRANESISGLPAVNYVIMGNFAILQCSLGNELKVPTLYKFGKGP